MGNDMNELKELMSKVSNDLAKVNSRMESIKTQQEKTVRELRESLDDVTKFDRGKEKVDGAGSGPPQHSTNSSGGELAGAVRSITIDTSGEVLFKLQLDGVQLPELKCKC